MIKTITKYFDEDEVKIKRDIVRTRIFNLILAFTILFSFLFIEKIPLETLFKLHNFLTDPYYQKSLILLAAVTIALGYLGNNWSLSITIIIFLTGQIMFINVFADKYSLNDIIEEKNSMNREYTPRKIYSHWWNVG